MKQISQLKMKFTIVFGVLFPLFFGNVLFSPVCAVECEGKQKTISEKIENPGILSFYVNLTYCDEYQVDDEATFVLDIYVLLLDGYLEMKYLQVFYDFGNQQQIEFLQILGGPITMFSPQSLILNITPSTIEDRSGEAIVWFKFGYNINGTLFNQITSTISEDNIVNVKKSDNSSSDNTDETINLIITILLNIAIIGGIIFIIVKIMKKKKIQEIQTQTQENKTNNS